MEQIDGGGGLAWKGVRRGIGHKGVRVSQNPMHTSLSTEDFFSSYFSPLIKNNQEMN
jgi:hypothetical protein